MVLLALLCVQVVRFQQGAGGSTGAAAQVSVSGAMRGLLWVTFGVLIGQIALGGWVSTNYAVLACSDFPRCQGN